MARYSCNASVKGGKWLGHVEADSAEEALKKAWALEECFISLCHQCAGECEDPQIESIDVDLDPLP